MRGSRVGGGRRTAARGRSAPPHGRAGRASASRARRPRGPRATTRRGKRLASGGGARLQARWHALVEELRLQPLQPGRALIDRRLPQPHAGAHSRICTGGIQASGSSPASSEPQLQVAVAVVGLRASLAAPPGGRLCRIGEPRNVAGTLDLLDQNRQPVVPSSTTQHPRPANCSSHWRSGSRAAGLIGRAGSPRSPAPTS